MVNYLTELLASFLAVAVVLTLHEFAHAFVAYRCGDPTPKWYGRLTLDPLKHFDILGLVCFTLVGFGWAKPVPINPYNFRKYKRGLFLTASAGIVMNLCTALLFYPLIPLTGLLFRAREIPFLTYFLEALTFSLYAYSLSFAVFNLLPLFPLDGFRIVDALARKRGPVYRTLRDYGQWILLGLIVESYLCRMLATVLPVIGYFDLLGWVMRFATGIVGWPIQALWGLLPW